MEPLLDDCSKSVRTCGMKIGDFISLRNLNSSTAVVRVEIFIHTHVFLQTCASNSEQPFSIVTMISIGLSITALLGFSPA